MSLFSCLYVISVSFQKYKAETRTWGAKMKKAIILTLIIAAIILCGIIILKDLNNKNITQPSGISLENLNQVEGVSLADAEYDRATKSIVFTLKNNTDKTINYGDEIILEKSINGDWHEVLESGKVGFTSQLNYLLPFDKSRKSMPIKAWKNTTNGSYRIIQKISIEEGSTDYPISIEFTINK